MFTIFAIPKSFADPHIRLIQENAIKSWISLKPKCEVFLVGNDPGVKETAEKFKVNHISNVQTSQYRTPLLDSAFNQVNRLSSHEYLLYANADIMFTGQLMNSIKFFPKKDFLITGQRWDIDIAQPINFEQDNWEQMLIEKTKRQGTLHPVSGMDYFIFRKDTFNDIPGFTVGRIAWDNWMIYNSLVKKMYCIDATESIIAIHQNHPFVPGNENYGKRALNPEAKQNIQLSNTKGYTFSITDTNWQLSSNGLKKKKLKWDAFIKYIKYTPLVLSNNLNFIKILKPIVLLINKIVNIFKKIINKIKFTYNNYQTIKKNKTLISRLIDAKNEINLVLGSNQTLSENKNFITIGLDNKNSIVIKDFTKPLPFPSNSVNYIYLSYLLQKLSYPGQMLKLLNECNRILSPNGTIRVCVPNAKIYTKLYLNTPDSKNYDKKLYHPKNHNAKFITEIDYLNMIAYRQGDHKHMFDQENLLAIIELASFKNILIQNFDPAIDDKNKKFEAIYAQAIK